MAMIHFRKITQTPKVCTPPQSNNQKIQDLIHEIKLRRAKHGIFVGFVVEGADYKKYLLKPDHVAFKYKKDDYKKWASIPKTAVKLYPQDIDEVDKYKALLEDNKENEAAEFRYRLLKSIEEHQKAKIARETASKKRSRETSETESEVSETESEVSETESEVSETESESESESDTSETEDLELHHYFSKIQQRGLFLHSKIQQRVKRMRTTIQSQSQKIQEQEQLIESLKEFKHKVEDVWKMSRFFVQQ